MVGKSEDLSLGHSISDSSEGLLPGEVREEGARVYRSFCNTNQVVRTSEDDH